MGTTHVGHAKGLLVLVLAALAAGCAANSAGTVARLRTDNPRVQVATIAEVARANDRTMVGELFSLLESEDEGVRFMAAAALHQMTGKDFGFHRANGPEERAAVAAQWREWWEREGRPACGAPPSPPGPPPATNPPKECSR
jgi:hypothetical protein